MTDVAADPATETDAPDLDSTELYANRELSWLDFNERVLQLAEDDRVPLLERVKFLAIYTTNLDEFFMVRVGGLHDQVDAGVDARRPDGLTPGETIDAIAVRVTGLDERSSRLFQQDLRPKLDEANIRVLTC